MATRFRRLISHEERSSSYLLGDLVPALQERDAGISDAA